MRSATTAQLCQLKPNTSSSLNQPGSGSRAREAQLARLWYEFTHPQTALSYQMDKLGAVEGIVQYMDSDCIAGLWMETFVLVDLLWLIGPRYEAAPARKVEPKSS